MTTTQVTHKVQLVDGEFTASETADVLNALLDVKINFHKLHRLSKREGNIHSDCSYDDSRVVELHQEKVDLKAFCKEARLEGKKIRINGILNIELID